MRDQFRLVWVWAAKRFLANAAVYLIYSL